MVGDDVKLHLPASIWATANLDILLDQVALPAGVLGDKLFQMSVVPISASS